MLRRLLIALLIVGCDNSTEPEVHPLIGEWEFLKAVDNAILGASGILIQFPLYFGIMGIMNHSGMADIMSSFFVSISNKNTLSIISIFIHFFY